MRRKLKSLEVMRVIFPEVLADYFEIVDVTESDTCIDIFMDEREFMEREDYKKGTVRSYGFIEERGIYAYVDAQRKACEQKRPTARGVLWGMLKDYLFTSEEKAMIDKILPKETQERIFSFIHSSSNGK